MTAVDEDGVPSNVYMTERTINAIDMLNAFLWNTNGAYVHKDRADNSSVKYLINNNALFVPATFGAAFTQELRNMTDQYGFIPMPKYDADQESYRTYVYPWYFSIPITVPLENTERASLILEALNIESYKHLYYTYYVEALQNKFTRDEESIEMIDIVIQGRSMDFAEIMTALTEQMRRDLLDQVAANTNFFASWHTKGYERMTSNMINAFDEVIELYEEKGL